MNGSNFSKRARSVLSYQAREKIGERVRQEMLGATAVLLDVLGVTHCCEPGWLFDDDDVFIDIANDRTRTASRFCLLLRRVFHRTRRRLAELNLDALPARRRQAGLVQ